MEVLTCSRPQLVGPVEEDGDASGPIPSVESGGSLGWRHRDIGTSLATIVASLINIVVSVASIVVSLFTIMISIVNIVIAIAGRTR